jgi:hypothetical protein
MEEVVDAGEKVLMRRDRTKVVWWFLFLDSSGVVE